MSTSSELDFECGVVELRRADEYKVGPTRLLEPGLQDVEIDVGVQHSLLMRHDRESAGAGVGEDARHGGAQRRERALGSVPEQALAWDVGEPLEVQQ